jgi:8-amino-7-oxononanoate synthase
MQEELDRFLTKLHKGETSLLFSSGDLANMGLFSTVPQKVDTINFDQLIYPCIKEGVRLSDVKHYPFKDNDLDSLIQ